MKITRQISKNDLNDFTKYTVNKQIRTIFMCAIILIICSIVMFVLKKWLLGSLYAVLGVMFLFFKPFILSVNFKANEAHIGINQTFEFMEDKVKITDERNGENVASTEFGYKQIVKTVQTEKYVYLYVNKTVAYILEVNDFASQKDIDELFKKISLSKQ